jgi:hypothetical protein
VTFFPQNVATLAFFSQKEPFYNLHWVCFCRHGAKIHQKEKHCAEHMTDCYYLFAMTKK